MAISGDYSRPVTVNGFSCRNCQDVSLAKRNIDPEHPLSGPYGVSADSDPTQTIAKTSGVPSRALLEEGVGLRLDIRA
ncbi:hypothetical protein IZ6_09100 [Terrihabitans soli]|uniref:Uncharacterized protein n=1 Tax=Terrihabitans soli TaxID=708113 RepID=A0A6S6QR05_9HYPH|nr:hypothetical protein [Terrihabitans soli]BCJ90175.1 hypothetical protein IZ6_09100 [Terrihabitans soli]